MLPRGDMKDARSCKDPSLHANSYQAQLQSFGGTTSSSAGVLRTESKAESSVAPESMRSMLG
ncbi:hypothetical protein WG66_011342 [Moniliophthora roreri]|nr:hypothetical protein WG66_011342 [Moniliophthora roreri]